MKMQETIFEIAKMDCPSEESLIRIKLDSIPGIYNLVFDIPNRQLTVYHDGRLELIEKSLLDLNLGAKRLQTGQSVQTESEFREQSNQRKLLLAVLAINFAFFIIEMVTGMSK